MLKIPITKEGAEKLRAELERLKTIERPKIVKAISEARAHGDLKENAEYHAAKEQQRFNETKIASIESKLTNLNIVDITKITTKDKIVFGAIVHLHNPETEKNVVYQIVGEDETDLKVGKISVQSPLSRALIGKKIDDVVDVNTPSGITSYLITKIE